MRRQVEKDIIILEGRLNMGVPFLSKTLKGNVYTPRFYIDDNACIQNAFGNNNKFYTFRNGSEEVFVINDNINHSTKTLKSLALATTINGKTEWKKLMGYGNIAIELNRGFKKGDLVRVYVKESRDFIGEDIYNIVKIELLY